MRHINTADMFLDFPECCPPITCMDNFDCMTVGNKLVQHSDYFTIVQSLVQTSPTSQNEAVAGSLIDVFSCNSTTNSAG